MARLAFKYGNNSGNLYELFKFRISVVCVVTTFKIKCIECKKLFALIQKSLDIDTNGGGLRNIPI